MLRRSHHPRKCEATSQQQRPPKAPVRVALDHGFAAAVRLLEPGRRRRGKPMAFWLWSVVGVFVVLFVVLLLWALR